MITVNQLRRRAVILRRRKQTGFTLLELLVVVAILAAIAGTAALALQDTDARASAAAHVAMMDELNKGISSYRVLNKNQYPDRYDSLLQATTGVATGAVGDALLTETVRGFDDADFSMITINGDVAGILNDIGIETLRNVYLDAEHPDGDFTCTDLDATIKSRSNHVVAGNIYMSPAANGCGGAHSIVGTSTVAVWTGGSERIIGNNLGTLTVATAGDDLATITGDSDTTPVYMTVGLGPSSSLFEGAKLGSMTSVPVYRHVQGHEYNRFIALFQIGTVTGTAGNFQVADQAVFVAVVDGAGDTKEEELGEWDGTRNTI